VFPMAMPMIAGPGSIASAMLWVSRAEGRREVLIVLAAITVVILLTMVTLLAAGPLMRLIGERIEAMITRILGVILAALAAQFIVDGLKQSFPTLASVATRHILNGESFGSGTGVSQAGTCPLAAAAP
jgi:multiple antibiotic resistance protein